MSRFLIGGVILLVLALDWAALHDILKGEADTTLEYSMLAVSLVFFIALGYAGLRRVYRG